MTIFKIIYWAGMIAEIIIRAVNNFVEGYAEYVRKTGRLFPRF